MRFYGTTSERLNHYSEPTATGCVVWTGPFFSSGYGSIRDTENGKTRRAHIVAYEDAYGKVPEGKIVAHICDNKSCVNPLHLEALTRKQNTQDAWARGLCVARRGEDHPMSKLSDKEREEIAKSTLPAKEVAEAYGVSDDWVWQLRKRMA